MILPIYLYGQPVLRKEAEDVTADEINLKELIDNMYETMYHADGVGLAGPQVGLSLRLFVIDANVLKDDYPECANLKRAMINPFIYEFSDDKITLEEGCLSLPGIQEKVARSAKIKVKYKDVDGTEHDETFEGFAARVVQHEYEHLSGHVFIDNCSPIRKQLNKGRLNKIIKGTAHTSYRVRAVSK